MIIKRGQPFPGLALFTRKSRFIKAKKMREPFLIETGQGWHEGKTGDWLVNLGDDLWMAIEDKQFLRIFRAFAPGETPCAECEDALYVR